MTGMQEGGLIERPLRLWPGFLIVLVQWFAAYGTGWIAPGTPLQFFGMMGAPLLALVLFLGWWLFASRAPRPDRLLGAFLPLIVVGAVLVLGHSTAFMPMLVYGLPIVCLLFVITVTIAQSWLQPARLRAMAAVIIVAAGGWTLLRSEGVDGDMGADLAWRWQPTLEERFLASRATTEPATAPTVPGSGLAADLPTTDAAPVPAAWPGFRGARRDGVINGLRIATDWQTQPPTELWRRPVGPGWSSFAVDGDVIYTQEQHGEEEVVAAYRASTGETVWLHRDPVRFWEALAGAGPRATPTLDGGRLYALGATGLLNALDAATGASIWQRDIAADTGAPTPEWGFSSSPLVIDGMVVVHAGGEQDTNPAAKSVVAYDAATGEPRWFAPAGPLSYSSLHLTTLDGVRQLLLLTDAGISSHALADGAVLWSHAWQVPGGARIVQPVVTAAGDVLVGTGFGMGVRKLAPSQQAGRWAVAEGWTSSRLKPYFNDFVVHRDHLYGFDGRLLASVDLATGERAWKGGRYGAGQLVLLADQDLLLVLSERGEVALVEAKPGGFTEIAKMEGVPGKTWNHPVVVNGVLYVRNGEEMAAFRLSTDVRARAATLD